MGKKENILMRKQFNWENEVILIRKRKIFQCEFLFQITKRKKFQWEKRKTFQVEKRKILQFRKRKIFQLLKRKYFQSELGN